MGASRLRAGTRILSTAGVHWAHATTNLSPGPSDWALSGQTATEGPLARPPAYAATGLLAQRYGRRTFIRQLDTGLLADTRVKPGHELVRVGGRTPELVLRADILRYVPYANLEAALFNHTADLFWRWDVDAGETIECEFAEGTRTWRETLTWQPVPASYLDSLRPARSTYAMEKTAYGHWVTLSSLSADSGTLNRFAADAESLQQDLVVVLDVRGNTGGAAEPGTQWIRNLYGYANPSDFHTKIFASAGNLRYFAAERALVQQQGGLDAATEATFQKIFEAMQAQPGRLVDMPTYHAVETEKRPSAFAGRVYVLTDHQVFSSGELLVARLKSMPQVVQAGLPTDGSTIYSEIHLDVTPAGLVFFYPMTVDTDGSRESGSALLPDLPLQPDPALDSAGHDSLRMALEAEISRQQ